MTSLAGDDADPRPAGGYFRALPGRGIHRASGTHNGLAVQQARTAGCEALDRSIVTTLVPQGRPQTSRETRAAE